MKPHTLLPLLLACMAPGLIANEADLHIVADPVNYTGWNTGAAPMNAVWQVNSGAAPVVATTAGNTYFRLNNGVATTLWEGAITGDFELGFDALHTSYSRMLWVGVFNAAGTRGYASSWDSSLPGNYNSQGFVRLRKFDVANPATGLLFNTGGTPLGTSGVASGHNPGNTTSAAITAPFARITLAWTRRTGQLRLYVNGQLRQTATDTSFNSFSRIYAAGFAGSMIDNVTVRLSAGADVPFAAVEAEDPANATNGTVVRMTSRPSSAASSPELEASGRGYVQLAAANAYLDIPVPRTSDTLVLRHCIPDSASGGGTSATLRLLVNGVLRQTLTLDSHYNWLYGAAGQNGQSNSPSAGAPHVFWNETRFIVSGQPLQPGDTLRLQKGSGNTASYYRIDLVDFEQAPPPLPQPPAGTYLSVTDFGAGTGDPVLDTAAIKACIAEAKTTGKTVWMPPGVYHHNALLRLDGVKVRGSGMWHTSLIGTADGSSADFGFRIAGDGAEVSDLFIQNAAVRNRGSGAKAFSAARNDPAVNWKVENVWVAHSHVGFWMSGASNGIIRGCRVRFTYADSITFNAGASNNLIEHNHVRGSGDDGIATLSETGHPASTGNTFRSNTVVANWWGHNADLAGGSGHVFENNYIADNAAMGGLTVNHPNPYPMRELSASAIRGNVIVRGGGRFTGQLRGALWVFAGSSGASGVTIEDNVIADSLYRAIHLTGAKAQHLGFARNRIVNPGGEAVFVQDTVKGTGMFEDNRVSGAASGAIFRNEAGAAFAVSGGGNDW